MIEIGIAVDKKDRKRFQKIVKTLPEKVFKRHVGKAANKAMTPVSRAAKKLAPKDSGDYRKSIGKKKKTYSRNKVVWIGVGPRHGKAHSSLGHLIEFGHRVVTGGSTTRIAGKRSGRVNRAKSADRTGKGRVVGYIPAQPHLRPALRKNKGTVVNKYQKEIQLGILKEAGSV